MSKFQDTVTRLKLIPLLWSFVSADDNEKKAAEKKKVIMRVYAYSTILAIIIAVPAAVVSVVMHYVVQADIFVTLTAGLITLFIAMGFGVKLSKKFAKAA